MKQTRMLQPIFRISGRVAVDVAIDNDFSDHDDYGQATFTTVPNSRSDISTWDTRSGALSPSTKSTGSLSLTRWATRKPPLACPGQ